MNNETGNEQNDLSPTKKDNIRMRIETVLKNKNEVISSNYSKSLEELVEELKIYQYELEFQNDELQRIQLDLENSRNAYRTLFHQAPMGYVVLSEELVVVEYNAAFQTIFNLVEPIRSNFDFRRLIAPESQNEFHFYWRKLLQNQEASKIEISITDGNGNEKHIHVHGSFQALAEERHILLTLIDITNRKQIEAELKKYTGVLNLALNASLTAVWELNLHTLEISVIGDDALMRLIRRDSSEIKNIKSEVWMQWILEEDRKTIENAILNVAQQGDSLHIVRCRIINPSGQSIWVEIKGRVTQFDDTEKPQILSGIINDISKQVEYENLLAMQNQELTRLNKQKDKFYSIIAHDLRSPFNSFLGFTRVLSEELNSFSMTEIQHIADMLKTSSVSMFRLIENLLQWSRIQQGSLPFEPGIIDLPPLVMESMELAAEGASKKDISFITELPAELKVIADENYVKTIIRNLLFNAIKFTSRGGKVSISVKSEGTNTVVVSVHDSGIGMSAEMIDNLFRNSEAIRRKGTDGEPSTGLGLILCKELVEKLQGRIWAESNDNQGSTFYFTIPLSSQDTADGLK